MRAVVQRVNRAEVRIGDRIAGSIAQGMLTLVGIHGGDTAEDIRWMADKLANIRIFEDNQGLMNRSILDIHGEMLIVSQFTLLGDCRKGRRPSWSGAAPPEIAMPIYLQFVAAVAGYGIRTATGEFRAMMEVSLVNAGPVTIMLDSKRQF